MVVFFLISNSNNSLLVAGKQFIFVCLPYTVQFVQILYINNHVICEQRQFYFFPNPYAFISVSHVIVLARTFNMMLNRSSKRGHGYFFKNLFFY